MNRSAARALGLATVLLATAAATQTPPPPEAAPAATAMPAVRAEPRTDEQLRALIEAEGFTEVTITESDRRSVEMTARDADGRLIEFDVARFGLIVEFDVQDDRPAVREDLMRLLPMPVRDAARQAGIVDLREFDRSRRGIALEGYDAQGRETETRIEADGRLAKRHDRDDRRGRDAPRPDPAALRQLIEGAGYTMAGDIEFRRAHAVAIAKNPEGETVELHVERGGQIVRERRRLDLE